MDRTWMYNTKRAHPTFLKEAAKFVELAKAHAASENLRSIFCPCKVCKNEILLQDLNEVLSHIVERGFKKGYKIWTFHGEAGIENEGIDFDLEDMLRHVEPEILTGTRRGLDNWEALEKAAKELLYDEAKGCDKDYLVLRSVLELLRLKARHGWSDTSFNDLMDLLGVMLPKPNLLLTNTYQAKKLICPLSLGVQKIHACENHCVLYRKEFADLDSCPTCGTSRYKTGNGASDGEVVDKDDAPVDENKKIPRKVMWYLPVKDRLKRLYYNRDDAELMRWHQEGRNIDGPRQPGINIDVFLEPLMEDMQELWEEGLRMWDEYRREHFTLHAIIVVTINDLPANFSFSGQFKGKFGCLICIDKTSYKYLTSSSKGVYMHHRQFLPQRHRWCAKARLFDNTVENFLAPKTRTGRSVFKLTKNIKMLTVFLPIAIRVVKPVHTRLVITKLCYFFNRVSQKVFDPKELGPLQTFAIETTCQLEMFFPLAYFNMMEHLIVHIVPQIIEIGPLYLHEMWAYERYMSVLKGYVCNRAHPEGSMIEEYTTEEVVECCIDYMKDAEPIGVTPCHTLKFFPKPKLNL
uniref:TNP2-like protein n=1 Tax=Oryza sativa subsp. japonica TaxID=39947 RepID=Q8GSC6_ORYSJ|nr:putative transposon protein [Oryza sativa Japonica Group]AAN16333.1 TNP2-like protein [Oryza sativa Japonica Group]